jgi:uncharacterized protein
LLGDKTFEQCAGLMRIMEGDHSLDRSCVHPEAYPVVERILAHAKIGIRKLIGNSHFLDEIVVSEFKTALFKDGVEKISDLTVGMILEGDVTNVANFGAFVDVGVHQDGLVHIPQLTDGFVKDPQKVVKSGDEVRVKVQEIDLSRKRISPTLKIGEIQARPVGKRNRLKNKIHA